MGRGDAVEAGEEARGEVGEPRGGAVEPDRVDLQGAGGHVALAGLDVQGLGMIETIRYLVVWVWSNRFGFCERHT